MFRTLKASEIEVRVQQVSAKGATLLLYKDARCDMNLLDETVGSMNWERKHSRDNANCTVSIWDDKKAQWVSKEDTGTESMAEAVKGIASDSFKRACFNWGIGRELYTSPFIFYKGETENKNGKYYLVGNKKFKCSSIGYDADRNIIHCVIVDEKNVEVFKFGKPQTEAKAKSAPTKNTDDEKKKVAISMIMELVKEKGINKDDPKFQEDRFNSFSIEELREIYSKLKHKEA